MEYAFRDVYERYLDDLSPGDRFRHWPGRTITEAANNAFCFWTQNTQPLHIDYEYAAKSHYGRPLVNGLLVLSIAVALSIPNLSGATIANLSYDRVEHLGPVFIGDTIYSETEVLDVRHSRSRPDRGIVTVTTSVTNQRGEKVLTFQRKFMLGKSRTV